jgi:hypothetical protein
MTFEYAVEVVVRSYSRKYELLSFCGCESYRQVANRTFGRSVIMTFTELLTHSSIDTNTLLHSVRAIY